MSASGEYTLRLVCDAKSCARAEVKGDRFAIIIVQPSRMEAIEVARVAGWMLRHGGRTFCPDDAQKLRENHWREKRSA